MITNVSLVTVYVNDIDESKAFYTDTLGFVLKNDITLSPEFRWCTVHQADHPELELALMLPGPPMDEESADSIRRIMAKGMMHGVGLRHRQLPQDVRRPGREGRRVHPGTVRPPVRRRGGPPGQLRQLAGPGRAEALQRSGFRLALQRPSAAPCLTELFVSIQLAQRISRGAGCGGVLPGGHDRRHDRGGDDVARSRGVRLAGGVQPGERGAAERLRPGHGGGEAVPAPPGGVHDRQLAGRFQQSGRARRTWGRRSSGSSGPRWSGWSASRSRSARSTFARSGPPVRMVRAWPRWGNAGCVTIWSGPRSSCSTAY